jgi:hypothetical protein
MVRKTGVMRIRIIADAITGLQVNASFADRT